MELITVLASILLLSIVVERSTELVHTAKIFLPLRNRIALLAYPPDMAPLGPISVRSVLRGWYSILRYSRLGRASGFPYCTIYWANLYHTPIYWVRRLALFLNNMLGCGYCTSVWVAMVFVPACPLPFAVVYYYGWVIKLLLLHGFANLYHVLYERQKKWAEYPTPYRLLIELANEGAEEEQRDVV